RLLSPYLVLLSNQAAPHVIYTLPLHDALPISSPCPSKAAASACLRARSRKRGSSRAEIGGIGGCRGSGEGGEVGTGGAKGATARGGGRHARPGGRGGGPHHGAGRRRCRRRGRTAAGAGAARPG